MSGRANIFLDFPWEEPPATWHPQAMITNTSTH